MKVKIIILILLLGWYFIWGLDYTKQSIGVLKEYKDVRASVLKLNKESSQAKKDVDALYSQVNQVREGKVDLSDRVAITQALESLEGVTINSITAKKLNSLGESIIIATVTNSSDVSNFTDVVTCMEFEITSNDVVKTLEAIEDMRLINRNLEVYPTENQIKLEIQLGGGTK